MRHGSSSWGVALFLVGDWGLGVLQLLNTV